MYVYSVWNVVFCIGLWVLCVDDDIGCCFYYLCDIGGVD